LAVKLELKITRIPNADWQRPENSGMMDYWHIVFSNADDGLIL
jgi:hypothetical protein